jgi:hypothetical protein
LGIGVSLRTVYNIKNNKTWKHLREVGAVIPKKRPKVWKVGIDETVVKEIEQKLKYGRNMNIIAKEYDVPFYIVHDIKYRKL